MDNPAIFYLFKLVVNPAIFLSQAQISSINKFFVQNLIKKNHEIFIKTWMDNPETVYFLSQFVFL